MMLAPYEIAPSITVNPAICHGSPVITGTRVHVAIVVGSLAGGMTPEEIEEEYCIAPEDQRAALSFAAEVIGCMDPEWVQYFARAREARYDR